MIFIKSILLIIYLKLSLNKYFKLKYICNKRILFKKIYLKVFVKNVFLIISLKESFKVFFNYQ